MLHLLGILLCRITLLSGNFLHINPFLLPGKYGGGRAAYTYLAIKEQQNIICCHKAAVCTQRGSFS